MSEYKGKNQTELKKLLTDKRENLRAFRFNLSGSKVRNVKEGRGIRKDIARILTEMNDQVRNSKSEAPNNK